MHYDTKTKVLPLLLILIFRWNKIKQSEEGDAPVVASVTASAVVGIYFQIYRLQQRKMECLAEESNKLPSPGMELLL